MVLAFIPAEALASVSGVLVVAIIYMARSIAKLSERVARLEGRLEERGTDDG